MAFVSERVKTEDAQKYGTQQVNLGEEKWGQTTVSRKKNRGLSPFFPLALFFSFVFLFILPTSFAQGKSGQENGARESMLIWKTPFMGERYTVSGKDIFVVNLSLKRFLVSYQSEDAMERSVAYAFLLGVLDATEGTVWCDYRQYKSITLLEKVHSGLKDLDASHDDERAAHVVTSFLKTHWPCKER
jgi:hypothetical protein